MSELQVTAGCRIHDGQIDAFRKLAKSCLQTVKERDKGTLQYDWFLNEAQTECVVRERYPDSEALLAHINNLGDTFGRLLAVCDLSVELFGKPSPALLEATAGVPTKVYSYYQGL